MTVTMNKKKEMCATITKPGMYYPILRKAGTKATLADVACASKCFGSSSRGKPLVDASGEGKKGGPGGPGGKGKGGEGGKKGELASYFFMILTVFMTLV